MVFLDWGLYLFFNHTKSKAGHRVKEMEHL